MLDRIGGMVELEEPDPARWREQLHHLVGEFLRLMEAHRGIARVAIANIPTGENALRAADNMLALTTGDGDTRFRFAIDAVLDGLVARARRS